MLTKREEVKLTAAEGETLKRCQAEYPTREVSFLRRMFLKCNCHGRKIKLRVSKPPVVGFSQTVGTITICTKCGQEKWIDTDIEVNMLELL